MRELHAGQYILTVCLKNMYVLCIIIAAPPPRGIKTFNSGLTDQNITVMIVGVLLSCFIYIHIHICIDLIKTICLMGA